MRIWVAGIVIAMGLGRWAQAQETQKPDAQTPAAKTTQAPNAPVKIPGERLYNLLEEKSLVFPDIAASTKPFSAGQKFQLFVDNSISLHAVTFAAAGAAIGQGENSPTGYGQGWDAYGKRFGSSMGRQASAEFFGTFLLASVLHEDPRFFPHANPSFGHSVKDSLRRIFVTRNDAGHDVANISGLLGPAMGEGLANAYWPERNRTVEDTFIRYGFDLATRAGGNMLREYWPVFFGKLRRSGGGASH